MVERRGGEILVSKAEIHPMGEKGMQERKTLKEESGRELLVDVLVESFQRKRVYFLEI